MKKSIKKKAAVVESSDSDEFKSDQDDDSDDSFASVNVKDPLIKNKGNNKSN
jgi:hypothetical protein